jgi:hypothetical protein
VPVVVVGFVLAWMIRETALRTTSAGFERATLEN